MTNKEYARERLEELKRQNVKRIDMMLNKVTYDIPEIKLERPSFKIGPFKINL